MDIDGFISKNWMQIGLIWLMVVKVLTAVQDAIDATPKDAPIIRKIVNVMNATSQYLFLGNRTKGGVK